MKKNSTTDSKKTLKSIICNVFTSGVTIIVSLISTVVITRIITVADLGIASSFNSLKSILTIICLLSVYISINRMILDIDGNDYEYLSSIYICLISGEVKNHIHIIVEYIPLKNI